MGVSAAWRTSVCRKQRSSLQSWRPCDGVSPYIVYRHGDANTRAMQFVALALGLR
jgi:hypothetical protein